jgi:uncharacterized protein (DUF433 family)
MKRKLLGKYIVIDPEICHGKPTFLGTRIMVWQVLDMLSADTAWDEIVRRWDGKVPREAIAETIQLAKDAFVERTKTTRQRSRQA